MLAFTGEALDAPLVANTLLQFTIQLDTTSMTNWKDKYETVVHQRNLIVVSIIFLLILLGGVAIVRSYI